MMALALLSLVLAALPALIFFRNLRQFGPAPPAAGDGGDISILIPARDEAAQIREAVLSALANDVTEVIVLDDHSSDTTAAIVRSLMLTEPRLRFVSGAALPPDWCGKNFACDQLAQAARGSILLFVDADVRLTRNAAARLAAQIRLSGAALLSGIPRQETETFSERLLVPLIHFVLLAYLPLWRMRSSRQPAYGTACGQLIAVEASAYHRAGGHAAIRGRLHDGLELPKSFRRAGFHTDLFDATDLARCRMYRRNVEVWRGFTKNAHEGLGSPARIVPSTLLLFGGQVLPFLLLLGKTSRAAVLCASLAAICALCPRVVAAARFRQPLAFAFLHPFAIAAMLFIQWNSLVQFLLRRPAKWKGRSYASPKTRNTLSAPASARPEEMLDSA